MRDGYLPDHWVYVVRETMTGCIKVGKSSKQDGIQGRIKSLQTGCPYELELIAALGPREHPGERVLHARLAKWRVRPTGEWFYGVEEAYAAIGLRRPQSAGTHQDVLNTSFKERDAELENALRLAERDRDHVRQSRANMRKREEDLVKREKDSYLRWRRQVAIEMTRPSKWGPRGLGDTYWNPGDYVMDYDLLRMIVSEAMFSPRTGAEFRRYIAHVAGWRGTCNTWGRIIGDNLRRHMEFLAENDPENYAEIDAMLRDVRANAPLDRNALAEAA